MKTNSNLIIVREDLVAPVLAPTRAAESHKGTYGHVLLIAGSKGKVGAALLSATACLRRGAGMLTVHIPHRAELAFSLALPEAMLSLDDCADAVTQAPSLNGPYNTLAMGPGLGRDLRTHAAVLEVVDALSKAPHLNAVLDADALNILAAHPAYLRRLPHNTILTPHPGEFDRLARALGYPELAPRDLSAPIPESPSAPIPESPSAHAIPSWALRKQRILQARQMARELGVIVVLKGHRTATCTPCGKIRFNTTGNPGMATAGCGDVLTGFIAALLAQRNAFGYVPRMAAVAGVYAHGQAGDKIVCKTHPSIIARDILFL